MHGSISVSFYVCCRSLLVCKTHGKKDQGRKATYRTTVTGVCWGSFSTLSRPQPQPQPLVGPSCAFCCRPHGMHHPKSCSSPCANRISSEGSSGPGECLKHGRDIRQGYPQPWSEMNVVNTATMYFGVLLTCSVMVRFLLHLDFGALGLTRAKHNVYIV